MATLSVLKFNDPYGAERVMVALQGMQERVAVHGGLLTAGPRPTGGFTVRASLPVAATEPTLQVPGWAARPERTR